MAEYVIQALEQSMVEKIFILQNKGANLQESLPQGPKRVFLEKDSRDASLAIGLFRAFEQIALYYGDPAFNDCWVMVAPCDTPLVTADNYNHLIEKVICQDADFIFTIISSDLLEKAYPNRRVNRIYLADYKADFTMQNTMFVNGRSIYFKSSNSDSRFKIGFRSWGEAEEQRIERDIDNLVNFRRKPAFLVQIAVYYLIKQAYIVDIFKVVLPLFFRRLTMQKGIAPLDHVCRWKTSYIESKEVELSADIDSPDDFAWVLGRPQKE
jgi:hypothetical protein